MFGECCNKKVIIKNIFIVAVCILINLAGKRVAEGLNLPVWMDMTGTCIAAYFVGLPGAIASAIGNNIIYSIQNPSALAYIGTGVLFAILIAWCVKKGFMEKLTMAMISSFWLGVACLSVSILVNFFLFDGRPGMYWGDVLYDMLEWEGNPRIVCAILGDGIVEILDKQVSVIAAFIIIRIICRAKSDKNKKNDTINRVVSFLMLAVISISLASPVERVYASHDKSVDYNVEVYNNSSGLMSSEANAIAETEDGCIWIGSYAGLTRCDGSSFEFINDYGITSVRCLLADSAGRLWVGTNDNGLICYENKTFTRFSTEDGLASAGIRALAEGEDGTIYIGTVDKLCAYKDNEIKIINDNLTNIENIAVINDSIICALGTGDMYVMNVANPKKEEFFESEYRYYSLFKDGDYLLAGTDENVIEKIAVKDGKLTVKKRKKLRIHEIISMKRTSDGALWICATDGVGYLRDDKFYDKTYPNFNNSFECVHEDYQGNIWIASSSYGVMKLSENQFSDIFDNYGIEKAAVNAVTRYRDVLYCATDTGVIAIGNECIINNVTQKLENERVRAFLVDSSDRLWIASYSDDGLLCYDGDRLVGTYNMKNGATSNKFRCIYELPDGTIVAGTADGVNFIKDGDIVATLAASDGLGNTQILSIAYSNEGLLVGTDGAGVYVVKDYKITGRYSRADGLLSDVILRMYPYDDKVFFVTGNGLCCGDRDGIIVLDKFPYCNNYDIIIKDGYAFIMSSAGVYRVKVEALLSGEEFGYTLYNTKLGLIPGLQANSWNLLEGDDLYICSNVGVIKFTNINSKFGSNNYKYGITSILCDGERIGETDSGFIIPKTTRHVVIQGSVKNYSMTRVDARFYVEGYSDSAEIKSDSEVEEINLYNLDAGEYKIHFEILNKDEGTVIGEEVYTIFKEPQPWETLGYRMYLFFVGFELVAFVIWTIVMSVSKYRKRKEREEQHRKNDEYLKCVIAEKTQELESSRQEIRKLLDQTINALSMTVEAKDRYTSGHSERVAKYARAIAERMGKSKDEQDTIYYAGLLHDVGKIRIPDGIINKAGKLTDEEFNYIKLHPVAGYHILRSVSENRSFAEGARFHHERYDGKGYPNGLSGENIPEIARIIGVADAYDAMASDRSYRNALPQEVVRKEIIKGRGTQFDPVIADIMLKLMDEDINYDLKQKNSIQKNILAIDDEPMNLKMVQFIFKDEDTYHIKAVKSGIEAIEIIKKDVPDIILLDIEMPEMDGFETLEKIQEICDTPVVFMTADKDLDTIQRAERMGVQDYITKPFLPMALKEVVQSILNGQNRGE